MMLTVVHRLSAFYLFRFTHVTTTQRVPPALRRVLKGLPQCLNVFNRVFPRVHHGIVQCIPRGKAPRPYRMHVYVSCANIRFE
jgi:hypothetical protein